MKGIVFTEFLQLVEDKFGLEEVDAIIEESGVSGIYTSVGTYDHSEMVELLQTLSARHSAPIPDLLKTFGEHLFGRFYVLYPQFFKDIHGSFDFLSKIDVYIHQEVQKLYPDAELPRFDCAQPQPNRLLLYYYSTRHLEDLAEGLIKGALAHFNDGVVLSQRTEEKDHITFELNKIQ
ncbi:hypothetical protein EUZ85_16370 [Hahella sp. KA22]|uniref:heme NO-binding domain-containing protein n=1 Tax=Hahella sp. KA22 TaxID=1628392 RepID=UPI000FDF1360|nr:heme NO-binding domain-containing protein [Hahella sp. KA22]AZZ92212.1 hypothetical protein ENC22_13805 [Hahella sp. KA22]QAY55583.1 hypothetical protein EUZ85_16370 [Hahella sp. KA22]